MPMKFLLDGVFNFNMINYIKVRFLTMKKVFLFATAGLWKCSKIGALWGKTGQIFTLVVVGDYGNTTNGKMKNRKCG